MPRRPDYHEAFWIDPSPGLAGYPDTEDEQGPEAPVIPTRAVVRIRDRIGFRYEREVGPDDDVSPSEAAQLLKCSEMTIHRWMVSGTLRRKKRNGYWVVRVSEVMRLAHKRGRTVPMRRLLVVERGEGDVERTWIPTNWEAANEAERRTLTRMMREVRVLEVGEEVKPDVATDEEGAGGRTGDDAHQAGGGARNAVGSPRLRGGRRGRRDGR